MEISKFDKDSVKKKLNLKGKIYELKTYAYKLSFFSSNIA